LICKYLANRFCTNSYAGFYLHPAIAESNITQQRPLPFPELIKTLSQEVYFLNLFTNSDWQERIYLILAIFSNKLASENHPAGLARID